MSKPTRAQYTLEFKQEAVLPVGSGQPIGTAAGAISIDGGWGLPVDFQGFGIERPHRFKPMCTRSGCPATPSRTQMSVCHNSRRNGSERQYIARHEWPLFWRY